MLERYQKFEAEKALNDYWHNKKILKGLKEQLESITDATAIDYSKDKVSTTPYTDGVLNDVIRRNNLENKIEEYEKDINIIDYALEALPQMDRFILQEFFIKNQSKRLATAVISATYNIEQAEIYRRRAESIKKFNMLIFG